MLRFICIVSFVISLNIIFSQESQNLKIRDRVNITGFVKYMNTTSIVDKDSIILDHLIHNRIRFKFFITDKLTSKIEMRNRIFYGKATKLNPFLGEFLDNDLGLFDLSLVPINEDNLVFHSIIDRAYLKYIKEKWEFTIGRQRINWGVNLAFNPNDLFNAYSLVDFDYQERPGVDALRFQYYSGELSSLELAIQPTSKLDSTIVAGLWKFNKYKYDFQFLAGNYYRDIALGTGWAGNIKNVGFKTELTYFHPKTNIIDSAGSMSLSTTFDYSFKKGIYINGSVLFNSMGTNVPLNNGNLFQHFLSNISAKNLMPSKWTYFGQISGSFNPAINGSFSIFYMQGINLLMVMPSIVYDLNQSWELMITCQSAFGEISNKFKNTGTGLFLRLMYNF